MNKYGPKASLTIERTMRAYKKGALMTSKGKKVTNRSQAIAIGIQTARNKHYKVPKQSE